MMFKRTEIKMERGKEWKERKKENDKQRIWMIHANVTINFRTIGVVLVVIQRHMYIFACNAYYIP